MQTSAPLFDTTQDAVIAAKSLDAAVNLFTAHAFTTDSDHGVVTLKLGPGDAEVLASIVREHLHDGALVNHPAVIR